MAIAKRFKAEDGTTTPPEERPLKSAKADQPKTAKAVKKPPAETGYDPLKAARDVIQKVTGQEPVKERLGPLSAVPSGSIIIDDLIGGTLSPDKSGPKCLGYPRRHITEIYGAESSGKTTAAIQAIAAVQREGGKAMFLDFEHALDHQYAGKIGMSFKEKDLLLLQPETMEQGWQMIQVGIAAGVDLIVVDSVAAMVPSAELNDKKPGDAAKIGAVALSMSQNLPKICVWLDSPKYNRNPKGTSLVLLNQIRATISTARGPAQGTNENTPGGNALKFYAYLRVKFTRLRTERLAKKRDDMTGKDIAIPYGNLTQVKLVKSKVDGKQGFTSEIFIRFNYGIDDYYSLIEASVANRLVKKAGAFYDYGGQRFQGRDKLRRYLMDNASVFNDLRGKLLATVRNEEEPEGDLDGDYDIESILESSFGATQEDGDDDSPEEVSLGESDILADV